MLGKELKTIRVKAGYTQSQFAKILGATLEDIFGYEHDFYFIPPHIEEALSKIVNDKRSSILTDKVFSRDLFLKHMLTGNEVIDNIYLEADWLKEYDGKKVYIKATDTLLRRFENNKEGEIIKVGIKSQEYFFPTPRYAYFICKKEWLK